jgi:ADP-heptose:LPS heptosyltransferase
VGQRRQTFQRLLNVTPDIVKHDLGVLRYYCELVRALGVQIDSEKTEYAVSMESMRWAEECIALQCGNVRPPVVIHPGASGDYKIWPVDRFAALADRLHDRGIPVLLCGGNGDREIVNQIRTVVRHAVPVVITAGNLQHLAGIFTRSALVVCNDSGPRHLAVAAGAKTLALFRRHHDVEWSVYEETSRCAILRGEGVCPACPPDACADRVPETERYGSHCMRMITVDKACETVLAMISS